MAEKRMLSKVISISEKVNTLPDYFDMLLFTWMIPHTDDFGRLVGSPAKIKALVVPMAAKTIREVEESLNRLEENGLIVWYEDNGEKVIEIDNFAKHQEGLKTKKKSKFNAPERHLTSNNSYLSASESDIEEMLVNLIQNDGFIDGEDIITVERQLRIDNSYLDVVATGIYKKYLFEVKRQRLSNASIDQIVKYRGMIRDCEVVCTLIGNGLSSNFDIQRCKEEQINVVIYNDSLDLSYPLLINVTYRHSMLLRNRTELNRTEENRTEQKRREDEMTCGAENFNPYKIFEQEGFGTIGPLLKDQIDDLVTTYGETWYQEAMKTAVLSGKRSLSYVNGILKRWKTEGMDDHKPNDGKGSKLDVIDNL